MSLHGLSTELLETAVKAFVGAVITWAVSALFKKNLILGSLSSFLNKLRRAGGTGFGIGESAHPSVTPPDFSKRQECA